MSNLPEQPFVTKSANEILGELQEHVVIGVVKIDHEEYTFSSGVSTYTILCGSPDVANGALIAVNRLWGVVGGTFYEFVENTDFTVDLPNNQITFIIDPDDTVSFFVSYRYDQQIVSGITDVSQGSVTYTLLQSFSRQIASCWRSLELIKASAYIDTAQGDDLDELLKLVGVTRNVATGATGYVTFYRDGVGGPSDPTLIPVGSQVAAQRTDRTIYYETTEAAYFLEGFSSARAPVEALDAYVGKISNMGPNRITRLVGSAGGASRCNNPPYYTDYEFKQLLGGDYTYQLDHIPVRVINTMGLTGTNNPPWAAADEGVIAVWGFRDISMETANWTTNNVTITEDDPEEGQLKCAPTTTASAYIYQTFNVNMHTYPHVFVMIRGTEDDEFNVDVEVDSNTYNIKLYEFGSTSSTTQGLVNLNWTLYGAALFRPIVDCINRLNAQITNPVAGDRYIVGPAPSGTHWVTQTNNIAQYNGSWSFMTSVDNNIVRLTASTSTFDFYRHDTSLATMNKWTSYSVSTSTFNIIFKTENDYWVDFIGVGHELEEVSGVSLSSEDEIQINYTSKVMGVWYVDENNNFFQKYDGDDSDGKVDYLFVYYKWNNNISGAGDEEVDDALRIRGRTALQVAAKGTKEAIKNAVLEIDGISQCEVSDYNDDPSITPGVCHIFVLARGFTVSPSLNSEIVTVVDDVRAAGVQAKIFLPQVRYSNFTLNVVYDDSLPDYVGEVGQTTLRNIISSALDDFFADATINDPLYFSELFGFLIKEVRGLEAAYINWDDATTPIVSDDDYDGTYAYDSDIVLDDPQRITGVKTDATIVIQRGNGVTVSSINLYRKSDKR